MMERHSRPAGAKRRYCLSCCATAVLLTVCLAVPAVGATQDSKTQAQAQPQSQQRGDGAVRVSVHNVKYRFAENVSVQINNLSGAIVPIGNHEMPVFDDKESFKILVDSAEVAISPQDVANLLNQFVFARPGSQLSGVSVASAPNGHLKIKGRLKDKGGIPFEADGVLVATDDGKLRLHADKMKALKIPVGGLMDAFGLEIDNLIKSGKVAGLTADGNDLIFDLEQLLPAPRVEGKVTKVRVEPNTIVQTFTADAKNPPGGAPMPKMQGNYIAFRGNKVRSSKVTIEDCDIVVMDMDPADPLDVFLDRYKEQVAAGYTKATASFQVRVYIKDYGKLAAGKNAGAGNTR
jgi:hypothetical protein